MRIGNVDINGYAALAPMAGTADKAFRELCVSFGASYVVGEMASSKGMSMNDKKSAKILELSEKERPAAVQLFGASPETMAVAAKMALDYMPDVIDINMGCPAPKVTGIGCGAALMKDPVLAEDIVKTTVDSVRGRVPVTVKIRAGWDESTINAVEIAKRCEDAGASAITIHGRTRMQMYSGKADYDIIYRVKRAVSIPVIGNGDISDAKKAAAMMEETGCDMVMVGRGALGNPWIFSEICAYLNEGRIIPSPPTSKRMLVMLEHVEKICKHKGVRIGIKEARKHAAWYIKGIRGAASYRSEVVKIENLDDLKKIAWKIIENDI